MTSGGLERMARRVASVHGHQVARPVRPESPERFLLTYVRTGPRTEHPVLVVPGGPGMASVAPYVRLRAQAARRGIEMVMVEHRGIGLSRTDQHGRDLPADAVTIEQTVDDLAAVLDHAEIPRATLYGSSYGAYLVQGFGMRHPDRVAGMVLDSPLLSARDLEVARAWRRALFWDGTDPALASVAAEVRALAEVGVSMTELVSVVQLVHEFAGPRVLHGLLTARRRDRLRRTWRWAAGLGVGEIDGPGVRFVMEPDLVEAITYRQLGFGRPPDGGPLDPQLITATATERRPTFATEPFDLPAALPRFSWPVAVISGERDLRTPPPIARRIARLAPGGVLVSIPGMGHSALDTHQARQPVWLAVDHQSGDLQGQQLDGVPLLPPRPSWVPPLARHVRRSALVLYRPLRRPHDRPRPDPD